MLQPFASRRSSTLLFSTIVIALITVLTSACGSWQGPGVHRVRQQIELQYPSAEFDLSTNIRLGRISTALLRGIANMALDNSDPEERMAQDMLRGMRRVHVAVYDVRGMPELEEVRAPHGIERLIDHSQWQVMVEAREQDSISWVLSDTRHDAIRGLYVVALDRSELVLVRIDGNITEALAAAVAARPDHAAEVVLAEAEMTDDQRSGQIAGEPEPATAPVS